jgi:hypothetical protein
MQRVVKYAVLVCAATHHAGLTQAAPLRVVALSSETAVGSTVGISWFGSLALNNTGNVSFSAHLAYSPSRPAAYRTALWGERSGRLEQIAGPGYGFWDVVYNDAGTLAYTNSGALVAATDNGDSHAIAVTGQPAPATSPQAPFTSPFNYTGSVLNNRGEVAFAASAGGLNGLWAGPADALSLVAQYGQSAAGDVSGRIYYTFGRPLLNDVGQLVFSARIGVNPLGYGVLSPAIYAWSRDRGVARLVGPGDTLMTDRGALTLTSVFHGDINNEGFLTLTATFAGGSALLIQTPTGMKVIATSDQTIGNEHIVSLTNVHALSRGSQVAYSAAVKGGDAVPNTTYLIAKNAPGVEPNIVARTQTQAPGAPDGIQFLSFGSIVANSVGQVAFQAHVRDVSTGASASGIWAEDLRGILRKVVMVGDVLDVDDGAGVDLRTVGSISGVGENNNQSGLTSLFNDLGQFVFSATFTDLTSAVFVSNAAAVPEPTSVTVLIAISVLAATSMRRTFENSSR